jgi:hypothetical protein
MNRAAAAERNLFGHAVSMVLLAALPSCKPDDVPFPSIPTGPGGAMAVAAHISAPHPMAPADGAETSETEPTLSVQNATVTDASIVTYRFQVATDREFQGLVANGEDIVQGEGQTSWRVSPALDNGRYFWRTRAENQRDIAGPYSPPSTFTVRNAGIVMLDSLTNGTSVGEVGGGLFLSQGWEVTSKSDFIRYPVPTMTSGFIEWENTGLRTTNPAPDNVMLLGMYDASPEAGPYRTNAFRVHLRKLDSTQEPPFLRLRWIANGEQHDTGANIELWEPGRVYRWRVEWGPGALGNAVQVFLDDVPILLQQYTREYAPKEHRIELGVEERRESIVGVVYSNVRIGRR